MKKLLLILLAPLALLACKKDPELVLVNETLPTNTTGTNPANPANPAQTENKGVFMNAVHPTSGTVKIVKDAAGNQFLSFENFKTDPGPDLRVYLAEDKAAKNFVEVAMLNKLGTFSLPLQADAKPEQRKYVLIWCRQFSVLFGSAELP